MGLAWTGAWPESGNLALSAPETFRCLPVFSRPRLLAARRISICDGVGSDRELAQDRPAGALSEPVPNTREGGHA